MSVKLAFNLIYVDDVGTINSRAVVENLILTRKMSELTRKLKCKIIKKGDLNIENRTGMK